MTQANDRSDRAERGSNGAIFVFISLAVWLVSMKRRSSDLLHAHCRVKGILSLTFDLFIVGRIQLSLSVWIRQINSLNAVKPLIVDKRLTNRKVSTPNLTGYFLFLSLNRS